MAVLVTQTDSGMHLRDLLDDPDFPHRELPHERADRRFEALNRLARVFAAEPEVVLQNLVDIAVEFCGADGSGISLEEPEGVDAPQFRWIAVAGSFRKYLNGTTPWHYSPCGTCLDLGRPQLYRVTAPYYDFLGVIADPITDGILIPWNSGDRRGTLWAVAHNSDICFAWDDYQLLQSLADFAAIAIRHQHQEEILRRQAREQASNARANQLAHQINNPLQGLMNTLYLAMQGGAENQPLVEQAAQQVQELSNLVRKLLQASSGKLPDSE